jgi:APA family basic amino acid/polyamine antiporter
VVPWVRIAAAVAAGGALLSLLAGVGRTLFAMGRGGDAPGWLTPVSRHGVPHRAQVVAAAAAAVVSLVGGIGGALAVSGASILLYYGVAHLAALRMRADEPRAPRAVPLLGLIGCVLVASSLVAVGLGLLSPGA